ncbi:MAG: alpha/beta hydrolase [Candidatus Staskawiczbacteria bacterium]|nr:alpha/beta hydrolase [Candidatus Staskawiczbacteria bacterium]
MTEEKVLVGDLKINYKTFGRGRPMLILHGWSSSSDKWQSIGETLAGKNMKIIVPDLPGFGKSQEPQVAWSLDNYVEWVKEFSENISDLKGGFILLGHSFGGAIAAKFAIKYNQSVEKLFLVSAACVREKTAPKKALSHFAKLVKKFEFLPFYDLTRKAFYKFILRRSDYPYVSGIMKETYLKVISEDLSPKMFFIKAPTTIIWGDKDDLTPIEQAYFINKKIENSNLVVIEGASHSLQIKQPEILAEKILENLST